MTSPASAKPASAGNEFFESHVQPIIQANCIRCHGAEKQRGGLRLDSLHAVLKGGDSGPALVAHQPAQSLLIEAVLQQQETLQMPPNGKLPDEQIKTLTAWVEMGAPWPDRLKDGSERVWSGAVKEKPLWSLRPIAKVSAPEVKDRAWPASPVDAFILAKLEENELTPAPPADRLTLLRRVTFDLTGLPPKPEEIRAFVADQSPHAYARVVERLLASPHYGEHWARHWLDLACFAETNTLKNKLNAFRYRDYVIDAFNDDLPYREFVIEQLAGDLLAQQRKNARGVSASTIGSGFLWLREMPVKQCDTFDIEVARADYVSDQLDVIGKTFLGMTVSCARCHAHKFDPISQEEYYALAGFLRSSEMTQARLGTPKAPEEIAPLWRKVADAKRQIDVLRARAGNVRKWVERVDDYLLAADLLRAEQSQAPLDERVRAAAKNGELDSDLLRRWFDYLAKLGMSHDPIFGPWVASLSGPADRFRLHLKETSTRSPTTHRLILEAIRDVDVDSPESLAKTYKTVLTQAYDAWVQSGDRPSPAHEAEANLVWLLLRKTAPIGAGLKEEQLTPQALATVRALQRQSGQLVDQINRYALASADGVPEDARLQIRGNYKTSGPPVPRGFIKAIASSPERRESRVESPELQGSGRMYLAGKIADANNPLTARVFVNRVWQHHFGEGLVRTPDNFGRVGAAPTHPELLDYLADKFVASGWSVKQLHRLMLLSRTYQMSSVPSAKAMSADPENQLLQHMPVRRLAAEEIRDAILASARELDPTFGGPSVFPVSYGGPLDGAGRRSIYLQVRRGFITPILMTFDYPNPNFTMGKRHVSIVPAQSLALMNSEFVHEITRRWGQRLASAPAAESARVEEIFWSVLGRPPSQQESAAAAEFLSEQRQQYTLSRGAGGPPARTHHDTPATAESQAWADLAHCLFNTNGFLFVH